MLMPPPSESAGISGVGTLETSTRDTLLIETCSNSNTRAELPETELVMRMPSLETLVNVSAKPRTETVRFRTLGCYPLSGAVRSTATTVPEVIAEMLDSKTSERQGRVIDHDGAGSMEQKKREGYF